MPEAMKQPQTIAVAIMLGLVGAALPIAGALYISWTLSLNAEQERLVASANRAITRANLSMIEIGDVFKTVSRSESAPCSPEHISEMRRLVFNAPTIAEIGFFENGFLSCTSWGKTDKVIKYSRGDYTTENGIEVKIRMRPLVTGGKSMMALQYGNYNALVDPVRFVDVLVDRGVQLAIASERGDLIGELNEPSRYLVSQILTQPQNGMTDKELYAIAKGNGWMAIAIEPREGMLENLRREQLLLLPIGGFISVFIVALVIWMSRRRLSPLGELQMAIDHREFIVHYQPIVELKTGRCVGSEALVRWRRPDGSLVRPDLFIPLAEESGLITEITEQVMGSVISDLKDHLIADRSLHVAINLSAADIKTGRALPLIGSALEGTGIEREQVWLEATERGFMDIDSAKSTITLARQLGHAVAIDDFGTGYSSLQYLQGLPLNVLKIDKAFVETIGKNTATSSVIAHIIDMARALDLTMVAEGVETESQARYLVSHHVEFAQGFLFSPPLPADEFIEFYYQTNARTENVQAQYQGAA